MQKVLSLLDNAQQVGYCWSINTGKYMLHRLQIYILDESEWSMKLIFYFLFTSTFFWKKLNDALSRFFKQLKRIYHFSQFYKLYLFLSFYLCCLLRNILRSWNVSLLAAFICRIQILTTKIEAIFYSKNITTMTIFIQDRSMIYRYNYIDKLKRKLLWNEKNKLSFFFFEWWLCSND